MKLFINKRLFIELFHGNVPRGEPRTGTRRFWFRRPFSCTEAGTCVINNMLSKFRLETFLPQILEDLLHR